MSSRTIAIRIVLENRDAIRGAREQTEATEKLALSNQKLSMLQQGLTNSFIKGNLAARGISAAYLALRDSIRFAVGESFKLEMSFAKMTAVTGGTRAEIESARDAIFSLSRNNAVAVTEISAASLELAKLGFEGDMLTNSLEGVVRLSAILGDSLEATGRLVGGIANTFALSAKQTAEVAEKLFVATGKSASDITGFGVAFNFAGAAAAGAGVSFEELAALIAALSNRGLRMSSIGTGLRTFFINMSNEASKASKVIGGGGDLSGGGLLAAMESMAKLNLDNSSLFKLFGKPGLPVAANMASLSETFVKFKDGIETSNGELEKGAALINDTVSGSFKMLQNAVVELTSTMGGTASSAITGFFNLIAEGINKVTDASKASGSFSRWLSELQKAGIDPFTVVGLPSRPIATGSAPADLLMGYRKMIKEMAAIREQEDLKGFRSVMDMPEDGGKTKLPSSGAGGKIDSDLKRLRKESAQFFANRSQDLFDMDFGHTDINTGVDLSKFKLSEEQEELTEAAAKAVEILNRELTIREQIIDRLNEITTGQQVLNQAIMIGVSSVSSFSDGISSRLVDSITGAKNAFEDFGSFVGNLFKKLVADMIALILKMMILKAISAALGGGAGAILPAVGGGLFSASVGASGTDRFVDNPTLFMAGESGRERVTITPRSKTSSGGQGAAIVVNIQGDVLDGKKFADAVKQAERRLKRTVF